MRTTMPTPTADDIRLDIVSMHEWRVCDRRFAENDARSVLGFIERHGDHYEIISVLDPTGVRTCGSLASATLSFSA